MLCPDLISSWEISSKVVTFNFNGKALEYDALLGSERNLSILCNNLDEQPHADFSVGVHMILDSTIVVS